MMIGWLLSALYIMKSWDYFSILLSLVGWQLLSSLWVSVRLPPKDFRN